MKSWILLIKVMVKLNWLKAMNPRSNNSKMNKKKRIRELKNFKKSLKNNLRNPEYKI